MRKMRLIFRKTGRAAYISHLDTMRTLQRSIARAEINAKHTEGFNPHAYISIALPLSLGYTSDCEMMDFVMLDDVPGFEITARLNRALPDGLTAVRTYETTRKVKEITAANFMITLTYDNGVPDGADKKIEALFQNSPVYVMKKSKRGEKEVDITQFIRSVSCQTSSNCIAIDAVLSAGNESLNPDYLVRAIGKYLPELTPDFAQCHRKQVFDENMDIFE